MSDESEIPTDPKRMLTELELVGEPIPDWRMLIDRLHGSFDTGDFVTAVRLVDAITLAAEEMNHHPDLDLAYGRLDVRLFSHDVGGVTSRDVVMAKSISELALAAGATPHPERTSVLELALDPPTRQRSDRSGRHCSATTSSRHGGSSSSATTPGVGHPCGSSPPKPTRFRGSAGTSTCVSRPRWWRTVSPPRSRPAVSWSTTLPHRRSGCSRPAGQSCLSDVLAGPGVAERWHARRHRMRLPMPLSGRILMPVSRAIRTGGRSQRPPRLPSVHRCRPS